MIDQIFYIILAILGLGFLVFIHELGHFWMARRQGMKVEVFSIGFGRPIYSWMQNGVRWQVGWLPFGGYVRIAGMQREGSREPHEIAEGFYSKPPLQRIAVAAMGPLVNIFFALIAFIILNMAGGGPPVCRIYPSDRLGRSKIGALSAGSAAGRRHRVL